MIERPMSDETKWLVTRGWAPATIDGGDPPSISSVICLSMDPGPIHFGSVAERQHSKARHRAAQAVQEHTL
jgi:hypothetical protein